ncbi:RNA polymerase III-inhibiting protein MAF1 [Ascoidea rubescens DSM 1968]|uniref:Maf1-domain-containing protein n=1 Tax=Ascoidea rubescens DSM 1968 TaxID=1344418 RepID=A0A1D2VNC0_9ASCO|nr:Maf1-domain-containing protein [Ascoidea rubescens DSM 1968]ODV63108.1 Maf1-domain-containing protein [Ascoidea rubescens DSM 1968]
MYVLLFSLMLLLLTHCPQFIDEFDLELVSQTLRFDTIDCHIEGGCDLFTTKPANSDKKLYKTIDQHLASLTDNYHINSLPKNTSTAASKKKKRRASISNLPSSNIKNLLLSSNINNINIIKNNNLSNQNQNQNQNQNSNSNSSKGIIKNTLKNSRSFSATAYPANQKSLIDKVLSNNNSKKIDPIPNNKAANTNSTDTDNNTNTNSNSNSNGNSIAITTTDKNIIDENSLYLDISPSTPINDDLQLSLLNQSPFGPLNYTASRRTFAYLIAILNTNYPDHDFSFLQPLDFKKISFLQLRSNFDNTLISLGKSPKQWIWDTINNHISINDSVIYYHLPNNNFLQDEIHTLWLNHWFIFNKKRKRVAFLYLSASRLNNNSNINTNTNANQNTFTNKTNFSINTINNINNVSSSLNQKDLISSNENIHFFTKNNGSSNNFSFNNKINPINSFYKSRNRKKSITIDDEYDNDYYYDSDDYYNQDYNSNYYYDDVFLSDDSSFR